MSEDRDIPQHPHSHSLYVHCLRCQAWGVPLPSSFLAAVDCGNCGSLETVKYYPSCCVVEDRQARIRMFDLPKENPCSEIDGAFR